VENIDTTEHCEGKGVKGATPQQNSRKKTQLRPREIKGSWGKDKEIRDDTRGAIGCEKESKGQKAESMVRERDNGVK